MAGEALRRQGRFDDARRWCDLAASGAAADDPATHIQVGATRASIYAATGDPAAALEHAEASARLVAGTDSPEFRADVAVARADALAAAGRRDEARITLDTATAELDAKGNVARARQLRRLRQELRPSRG